MNNSFQKRICDVLLYVLRHVYILNVTQQNSGRMATSFSAQILLTFTDTLDIRPELQFNNDGYGNKQLSHHDNHTGIRTCRPP